MTRKAMDNFRERLQEFVINNGWHLSDVIFKSVWKKNASYVVFINKIVFCVSFFVWFLLTFKIWELFLPHPVYYFFIHFSYSVTGVQNTLPVRQLNSNMQYCDDESQHFPFTKHAPWAQQGLCWQRKTLFSTNNPPNCEYVTPLGWVSCTPIAVCCVRYVLRPKKQFRIHCVLRMIWTEVD